MSKINFEEDQQEIIQKTGNLQTLADQVEMLEGVRTVSYTHLTLPTSYAV